MKLTRYAVPCLTIALLFLALASIVLILVGPDLLKGIVPTFGNPVGREKMDIRPIPLPVPMPPLAMNQLPVPMSSTSATQTNDRGRQLG